MSYVRGITDKDIENAKDPSGDLQLKYSESGSEDRITTFGQLIAEKRGDFNCTDYIIMTAQLEHTGEYHQGGDPRWSIYVTDPRGFVERSKAEGK